MFKLLRKILILQLVLIASAGAATVPDDFPRFIVPGHEKEMESMRNLFWLHYQPAGPLIPLWDEWMPKSTLWPAGTTNSLSMRQRWAKALSARIMNDEGYVLTQQHDGPAHAEGWPFPSWTIVGGVGWHFRPLGVSGYEPPLTTPAGWKVVGGRGGDVNEKGWLIELTNANATVQTPGFAIDAKAAPWLRLNWWATNLESANCYVEWTTKEQPQLSRACRAYFAPALSDGQSHLFLRMGPQRAEELKKAVAETRTMIPMYRIPSWKGTITGLRLHFDNPAAATVTIKSFHTACDTRQTVNNVNFIRGCHDYFLWTGDIAFLRKQMGRIRSAMRFMMNEFDTRRRRCVYTTWPGHEGRSGVRLDAAGQKRVIPGEGIGGNYWDILPFGGEDALCTIYYYDAVLSLADLEENILRHPQWCVATGADAFDPADLRHHAQEVKDYGGKRFWNEKTGRFGTVDLDGVMHDYGFTFLNNEAICFGFATPEQARSIRSWISGERKVAGDTATGADIYHWRFGPRATTRRNLDYYFWGWSAPESIPFGAQVQDGGAVLGFSFHDLMAKIAVEGSDSAWLRLQEIAAWFDETQKAGGYREYYKDPSRGTMQGGNTAGGLGLDKEFFESILVPQVMIYGFVGLQPTADGVRLNPNLPKDWPELTITGIHLKQHVLEIKVRDKSVEVRTAQTTGDPLTVEIPGGWELKRSSPLIVEAAN